MKNKDITIVTAFFDIGRKDFKSIPRSNEKYVEYFKFWARIKNNLVVYTDSVMAESVKKVRKEFGLLDKTTVITIDDISVINPEILNRMNKLDNEKTFLSFRYTDEATENNGLYNYVMLIKAWCVYDAVCKGYAKGQVAWLDFGFNHGGKVYINPEEFDFKWQYDFNDKITYFALKEDDNEPIFKKVQSYDVTMMGFMFIVPDHLAKILWELELDAMNSLLDLGFTDDDQLIMLMCYRKQPDIFDIKISDWFMPLKECGASHLTVKNISKKISLKDKLLYKYRVNKRNRRYLKRFKKVFLKDYLD